jgi:hypothetical protein
MALKLEGYMWDGGEAIGAVYSTSTPREDFFKTG